MIKISTLAKAMHVMLLLCYMLISSCKPKTTEVNKEAVRIGFIDYVEDATLAKAREGFYNALADSGYTEKAGTMEILYRNAQGDQPSLLQICEYMKSEDLDLIATNTTLATVSMVKNSTQTPVFMMVAPRPDIAGLANSEGVWPSNLFGVYETLEYIDTSASLILELFPNAKTIGTIYSQSESQSLDALNRLKTACGKMGLELISLPVSNSSESQLVTESILAKDIDVFFALPDNVIFSSFETVLRSCERRNIPIFTSEAGLVQRGALASYGADFYAWGYQCGIQAASYLKNKNVLTLKPELVKLRKRIYNKTAADKFSIAPGSTFESYP